jgi:hypothetical protein
MVVQSAGEQRTVEGGYDHRPVSELSRREVARKAGVDPDYVDRLIELGILKSGREERLSPGDVLRARWVQSLEAGMPLDGMAAAVRDGALSISYLDATVRSIRGGEREDVPRTERTDGCADGPPPSGSGGD